jgi:hypothetical protein
MNTRHDEPYDRHAELRERRRFVARHGMRVVGRSARLLAGLVARERKKPRKR